MAEINTLNIQGDYNGTLSSRGPTFVGTGNSVDGNAQIPVLVTGDGTSAGSNASYSFVGGVKAKANAPHSIVFNGDGSLENPYVGKGSEGTASFNTVGGLDGFQIGDKTLLTHMNELTSHVKSEFSDPDSETNYNIVHKSGAETVEGYKTFTSSLTVTGGDNVSTLLEYDALNLPESGKVKFKNAHPSLYLGTDGGSCIGVAGGMSVNGALSADGITLKQSTSANFTKGSLYVADAPDDDNSSLAVNSKWVRTFVGDSLQDGAFDTNGVYTGTNTFANIELSSTGDKGKADFSGGTTLVATPDNSSSSLAAANKDYVGKAIKDVIGTSGSVGSASQPIYLNGGSLAPISATVGSSLVPVYLNGGSITAGNGSVGGAQQPIYLFSGSLKACDTLVTTSNTAQNVSGRKAFSSLMPRSPMHVLGGYTKGGTGSIFIEMDAAGDNSSIPTGFPPMYTSMARMGVNSTSGENGYNEAYIIAFKNRFQSIVGPSLTLYVGNGNGNNAVYATAPTPRGTDGSLYHTTSTEDNKIPTIGWANTYFTRKDGAEFTGSLNAKSGVDVYGTSLYRPAVKFHSSLSSNYTSMISDTGNGIRIAPGTEDSVNDTATRIKLGSKTIGNAKTPVYLSSGVITPLGLGSGQSIGSSITPVYMTASGEITNCTSSFTTSDTDQTVTGIKRFTSLRVLGGGELIKNETYDIRNRSLVIYNDYKERSQSLYNTSLRMAVDFCGKSYDAGTPFPQPTDKFGALEMVADSNGSSIAMKINSNRSGNMNAELGVYISSDGNFKHGYAPDISTFRPDSFADSSDNTIATVGWCKNWFVMHNANASLNEVSLNGMKCSSIMIGASHMIRDLNEKILQLMPNYQSNIVDRKSAKYIKFGQTWVGDETHPIYIDGEGYMKETAGMLLGSWSFFTVYNTVYNHKTMPFTASLVVPPMYRPYASSIHFAIKSISTASVKVGTAYTSASYRICKPDYAMTGDTGANASMWVYSAFNPELCTWETTYPYNALYTGEVFRCFSLNNASLQYYVTIY